MRTKNIFFAVLVLIIGITPAIAAEDTLIFSTATTHSSKKTLEIYGPLVE